MDNFFTQTRIPAPNIDWKKVWPDRADASDPRDFFPRWRRTDPTPSAEEIWPSDIARSLISVGLIPTNVRIFRWAPNKYFTWHIDAGSSTKPTLCAINWVLEGSGMIQWDSNRILTTQDAEAYRYQLGELDDYYEKSSIGHACLVNTAIPHRVVNMNSIHRLSVSILFDADITYEDAYTRLHQANLL